MSTKSNYAKPYMKCSLCDTTEDLNFYRGSLYCPVCFEEKMKKLKLKDQEYAKQLRMHMLGNSKPKEI